MQRFAKYNECQQTKQWIISAETENDRPILERDNKNKVYIMCQQVQALGAVEVLSTRR